MAWIMTRTGRPGGGGGNSAGDFRLLPPGAGAGRTDTVDGAGAVNMSSVTVSAVAGAIPVATGAIPVVAGAGVDSDTDAASSVGMGTRMGGGMVALTGRSCAGSVSARVASHSVNTAFMMATSAFCAGMAREAMTLLVEQLDYSSSFGENVLPY